MDLVFSCPVCLKPLRVDPTAAGHSIRCPVCASGIQVPTVKTARLLGSFHAPATRVARMNRKIRGLSDESRNLGRDLESLARLQAETGRESELLAEGAKLLSQRVDLVLGELATRAALHAPGKPETVVPQAPGGSGGGRVPWVLAFAALALALLALFL